MNPRDLEIKSLRQNLAAGDIVQIAMRMLGCINKEITAHSLRTAFLSLYIAKEFKMNSKCSLQNLMLLAFFHTLGYYREDVNFNYNPHDSNPVYFSTEKSCTSKYMFTSFYLEYLTPLKQDARALSTFNRPYDEHLSKIRYQEDYKSVIYFAAHISDYLTKNNSENLPDNLNLIAPGYFNPAVIAAFNKVNDHNLLVKKILTDNYKQSLTEFLFTMQYSPDDTKHLESLLVYLLDFKSTQTMKHSINTACYSLSLGCRMNLNMDELSVLFTSAALHDIGKIATPARILEFPGKLSPEDMGIMRHHVNHSRRILSGFVPYEILNNVYRHHEKLNGTGYPNHISGDELTLTQRILTVADITSALNDSRSYKEEFSKDKTIGIITDMTTKGELDFEITKFVISEFDSIMQELIILQGKMKVDFSKVLANYNNYILNDIEDLFEDEDSLEDADEPDDLEELEEI